MDSSSEGGDGRRTAHSEGCRRRRLEGRHRIEGVALSNLTIVLAAVLLAGPGGCATRVDPALPITAREASRALDEMARAPVALKRPVVIVGGYGDPGLLVGALRDELRRATGDDRFVVVTLANLEEFDACAARLVQRVQEFAPAAAADTTVEVDAVAISMGGLAALHAAGECGAHRRLALRRLFTIGTPFRGAEMAELPIDESVIEDMRRGSTFLDGIERTATGGSIEIVAYGRTGDLIVGLENTAPTGGTASWVTPAFGSPAHLAGSRDQRIIADIARRLRGESPLTGEQVTPPSSDL